MSTQVKICGISTPDALSATAAAGARYAGFVFYPPSPRFVVPDVAAQLCASLPTGLRGVGLFVDPDDALIAATAQRLPLDYLQLHGTESPTRAAELRAMTGLKIIKAIGVADKADLAEIGAWRGVADMLLLDAKPPRKANALPGGNGLPFDWTILSGGFNPGIDWMLSGGLTVQNVGDAIRLTRPPAVDVSSGVEAARGVKDLALIKGFVDAVRKADSGIATAQAEKWGITF